MSFWQQQRDCSVTLWMANGLPIVACGRMIPLMICVPDYLGRHPWASRMLLTAGQRCSCV